MKKISFQIGCCGRKMVIEAFPFASQDGEYMTCAETTLWNILSYYGARYPEYRVALPSSGLNYMMSSLILKKFGFGSKIYYRLIENKTKESEFNFKRWFHYYVESGIPFMVGIKFDNKNIGHAVTCVGHGKIQVKLEDNKAIKIDGIKVFNSADFIDEYVYMDDNGVPFEINKFDEFKRYKENTLIKYFIAPLYKKIYIDASEAEKIFLNILKDKYLGIDNLKKYGNKFVVRIFLSTSRNYKVGRFSGNTNEKMKNLYINLKMPKFIWVCEIGTVDAYKNKKMMGEIVLDTTASIGDFNELLLIRYPGKILVKLKKDNEQNLRSKLMKMYRKEVEKEFDMLETNLMEVDNV